MRAALPTCTYPSIITTGLPAYSDIPATVTVFWSIKGSPFSEDPGYSDIPLTVILYGRPNTATVSGEAWDGAIEDFTKFRAAL